MEHDFQPGQPCPECHELGASNRLRLFYINLDEQIVKCESGDCLFPYSDEISSDSDDVIDNFLNNSNETRSEPLFTQLKNCATGQSVDNLLKHNTVDFFTSSFTDLNESTKQPISGAASLIEDATAAEPFIKSHTQPLLTQHSTAEQPSLQDFLHCDTEELPAYKLADPIKPTTPKTNQTKQKVKIQSIEVLNVLHTPTAITPVLTPDHACAVFDNDIPKACISRFRTEPKKKQQRRKPPKTKDEQKFIKRRTNQQTQREVFKKELTTTTLPTTTPLPTTNALAIKEILTALKKKQS